MGYWKTHTGKPSLRWANAVREALCFGWIDGQSRSIAPRRVGVDAGYAANRRCHTRWNVVSRISAPAYSCRGASPQERSESGKVGAVGAPWFPYARSSPRNPSPSVCWTRSSRPVHGPSSSQSRRSHPNELCLGSSFTMRSRTRRDGDVATRPQLPEQRYGDRLAEAEHGDGGVEHQQFERLVAASVCQSRSLERHRSGPAGRSIDVVAFTGVVQFVVGDAEAGIDQVGRRADLSEPPRELLRERRRGPGTRPRPGRAHCDRTASDARVVIARVTRPVVAPGSISPWSRSGPAPAGALGRARPDWRSSPRESARVSVQARPGSR